MIVSLDFSSLQRMRWYEWALRFVLGGLVTVLAGVLAQFFGPVFGGLFLAFPAIICSSATLIEKHEKEKKAGAGLDGSVRACKAAGLDVGGAELGSIGLVAFALLTWKELPTHPAALILTAAAALWLAVSTTLWWIRKRHLVG
jgi:hypothetical protein